MADIDETLPSDPKRVRAFASFFKNYMSVSSIVVAALPIPLTAFGALPTFADYKSSLSTFTSLFCFLLLGFIFYVRHALARWMFPEPIAIKVSSNSSDDERQWIERKFQARRVTQATRSFFINSLPFVLIIAAAILAYLYHFYLDQAVVEIGFHLAVPKAGGNVDCQSLNTLQLLQACEVPSPKEILGLSYLQIPWGFWLRPLYIGMFVAAEAAFILMATREYIQDLLKLTDVEIIRGKKE